MGGVNDTDVPLIAVTFTTCVNGREPNHSDQFPPWMIDVDAQLIHTSMPTVSDEGAEASVTVEEPRVAPPLMAIVVNAPALATSQLECPITIDVLPPVKLMMVDGRPFELTDPRSVTLFLVRSRSPLRLKVPG